MGRRAATGFAVDRLTGSAEFRRVYQSGTRRVGSLVIVHASPNDLGTVRLGLAVGRRFGRAAARNRLRRRLREAVRSYRPWVQAGVDLVVVPRMAAVVAAYADLREGVRTGLEAAGVLTGNDRTEP